MSCVLLQYDVIQWRDVLEQNVFARFPQVYLSFLLHKTNRFHAFVLLYCNRSQKTPIYVKNKSHVLFGPSHAMTSYVTDYSGEAQKIYLLN